MPQIIHFPKETKMHLDYTKMEVGDLWGTTSNQPLAVGIKARTWGWSSAFSLQKCNHIAIICKIGDQFFLAEALSDGIILSTCYKYLNPCLKNMYQQVCWIGRNKFIQKSILGELNSQIITLANENPSYDWSGVGAFVLPFKNNDKELFCSEMAELVLQNWLPAYVADCKPPAPEKCPPSYCQCSPAYDNQFSRIII